MIKPQTLKGFRDFLPQESRKRQYVINTLKTVFELYGFEPLETPVLEYEDVLTGKYGDEGDRLMYRFEDNGQRKVAMRYDQTVPLARVVAQYQQELTLPFKRYQIQPVWRAENTQKGRYREFLQCDIDIAGTDSSLADAEIIATAVKSLEALGFKDFTLLMNDRKVFSELVAKGAVTREEMNLAVIAVDKLKKIEKDGVINELASKGLTKERAEEILRVITEQEKTDVLADIDQYLQYLNIDKSKFRFEPTLARGLNYYTGVIFEIEVNGYTVGSICGGGRYDNLIGMFTDNKVPAVGCAFGFDRLIEAMEVLQLFPAGLSESSSQVLVTIFAPELTGTSIQTLSILRENKIPSELYLRKEAKLDKQLKYADQKSIPFVIVIGPEEATQNAVTLKNMKTREQKTMTLDDVIREIKIKE